MTEYQLIRSYVEVALGGLLHRVRDDERGIGVAEWIVVTGACLLGAAAVSIILWNKLTDGAGDIDVPAPAAP